MVQPSDDYRRHHDVTAPRIDRSSFRQGWRVRTRLDGLLADRSIGPGVWQAAVEYRDAWARVSGDRSSALGAGRISGGRDAHDRQIAVVDTLAELAVVERRIGRLASALCFACAVNDLSWPEIGRRCGRVGENREHATRSVRSEAGCAQDCCWYCQSVVANRPSSQPLRASHRQATVSNASKSLRTWRHCALQ